jgi:hypothetical protein
LAFVIVFHNFIIINNYHGKSLQRKAFVELASHDQFGLKVKLPNGNVASRVLPVRIYDLDTNDIKLCESILGSVLRSIDFIYKSS